jgi:hypothetical protein
MITETGTYRGAAQEHAVNFTRNGCPQFEVKLQAVEKYDYEAQEWQSVAGQEDVEITGYLTLIDKDNKPIFHAKDVMRTFEWDGRSLVELDTADLVDTACQWNVEDNEYDGKVNKKVTKIAPYDDTPSTSRGIRKLEATEVMALDAKFKNALAALGGGPKPVSAKVAPVAKPKVAPKAKAKAAVADPTPTTDAAEATSASTVIAAKPTSMPKPPALGKPKPPIAELTYESAWELCFQTRAATVTDDQIAAAFTKAMQEVAKDADPEKITGTQWAHIADRVVAEYGVF